MSVTKEKKFVIKHVFRDAHRTVSKVPIYGKEEEHFGFKWRLSATWDWNYNLYLECLNPCNYEDWSIETTVSSTNFEKAINFTNIYSNRHVEYFDLSSRDNAIYAEFTVKINKINGIELKKMRNFDEEKYSDVVLKIDNEKFHVLKHFLASHSSYFESLFFGNFEESKQSEVELKDIKPQEFQIFLELIYGETSVEHNTVDGILKLADFFDSKSAIRRCEKFLLEISQKTLKQKFELANNYKLDKLMEKCLSEIKTNGDFRSIIPSNPEQLSGVV